MSTLTTPSAVQPSSAPGATRGTAGVFLLACAAGSAAYAVVVTVLAHWPSVVHQRGSGGAARPALVAAIAVPLAVAGALLWIADRRARPRVVLAIACVGFGAAWVAWGLVEQHLLRTFDLAPGAAAEGAWDALFHAVGLVTAGVGTSLLSAGRAVPEAT